MGRGHEIPGISRTGRAFANSRSALISGLICLAASSPALADCEPAVPSSGDTVTCTGNPTGYDSSASLGALAVDIVPGTNFNGPLTLSNIGALGVATGGNLQSVTLNDDGSINFVNSGTINGGLVITGDGVYTVTNEANSFINTAFSFTGNSDNTITNSGTLNNGITVNGDGTTVIRNEVNAAINSGVFINGASQTRIDNFGTIQSTTLLGSGDDTIVNYDPGQINGSVDQGAGNDLFQMLGGRVSATVNQSDGSDRFELSGGEVTGNLIAGAAADSMLWTGGLIGGIDMGGANDTALFQGLSDTELRTIQIDGGEGADALTWQDTDGSNPSRLVNWELISLQQGSTLEMNNDLVLGDSATGSGLLSIDSTSALFGSGFQSAISPAAAGALASVINAGVIDLTSGSQSTSDSLTIVGNYVGDSGQLWLQTVLGGDDSAADKLVIDSGAASGSTAITEMNVGGLGAETDQGILVVEAINGATTTDSAFFLSGRVTAGVYEYLLYRGSAVPGTADNWYLRNTQDDGDGGDGGGGGGGGDGGDGGGGGGDGLEGNGGDPGTFRPGLTIRPEVPIMTVVPAVSRGLLRTTLGTFHERHGEQAWMGDEEPGSALWTRVYGGSYDQDLRRLLDQEYEGHTFGFEIGAPFFEREGDGVADTFGVFAGYSRAWGDVTADALNINSIRVGDLSVEAYSLATYWTRTWDDGSYIDGVLMYSWLDAETNSIGRYDSNFNGTAVTTSLEAGTVFEMSNNWNLEPQGQLIWQHQDFDRAYDPGGTIDYDNDSAFTGRIGLRLQGNFEQDGRRISPYLLTNLWHEFETNDVVTFNNFPVDVDRKATVLEFGAGATADLSENVKVYANASFHTNVGGEDFSAVSGRIGLRIAW